jgi:hypothetical protein
MSWRAGPRLRGVRWIRDSLRTDPSRSLAVRQSRRSRIAATGRRNSHRQGENDPQAQPDQPTNSTNPLLDSNQHRRVRCSRATLRLVPPLPAVRLNLGDAASGELYRRRRGRRKRDGHAAIVSHHRGHLHEAHCPPRYLSRVPVVATPPPALVRVPTTRYQRGSPPAT